MLKTGCKQCCGTGTAGGTVTFCLSGTGTGLHYGSGSGSGFGPGAGFGSKSNIKWNKKVKNQNLEANFLGNNAAASNIEKAGFCTIFLKLPSIVRIRNCKFSEVGTGTAVNHYGSTTLAVRETNGQSRTLVQTAVRFTFER